MITIRFSTIQIYNYYIAFRHSSYINFITYVRSRTNTQHRHRGHSASDSSNIIDTSIITFLIFDYIFELNILIFSFVIQVQGES